MLAYRTWRLEESGILRSPYVHYVWTTQHNQADCQVARGALEPACLRPPEPTCRCGFYAYPTLDRALEAIALDTAPNCAGLVQLYGRIIEHTDGVLRAQYVDLLALVVVEVLDPNVSYDFGWVEPKVVHLVPGTLARASALFGVPVITVRLAEEAKRWIQLQVEALSA